MSLVHLVLYKENKIYHEEQQLFIFIILQSSCFHLVYLN